MRFWDASAVIPLLVSEAISPEILAVLEEDRQMHVWWATEVECVSGISRYERKGANALIVAAAMERLGKFVQDWHEIPPVPALREMAKRLLRVHSLSAADALQLAAAWVLSEQSPASIEFVSLDSRLRDAASREGFRLLPSPVQTA